MVSCQTFFLEIAEIFWQLISLVLNTEKRAKAALFFLFLTFLDGLHFYDYV